MGSKYRTALAAGAAVLAGSALAAPAEQKVTGPVATYWMSTQTQTGFGMGMMGGGGGKPSIGSIMGAMRNSGTAQHTLTLQLGSSRKPAESPDAEHTPPDGLGAGPSLPLLTPEVVPVQHEEDNTPQVPREFQKPKGRMLIFWGCGQHARPGQPLVIDFAQMAAGKTPPPALMAAMRGLNITHEQPPSASRSATYGEWPNKLTRKTVPPAGSLVGDHSVRGNYTPDIQFTLTGDQDFLGPLTLTTNARDPGGWVNLGWDAVSNARAYLATVVAGGQNDTVVLWTSSEVQASAFSLPDYITPGDLTRLVASRTLMGPQTTSCQVPKEVLDAAPQGFLQMAAYGNEANFSYPPRPRDPKITWNRQWTVKVRYRSATGGLLGMAMPGMGGGDGEERQGRRQQQQAPTDPRKAILKGVLGGAFGF
jgi:hypothetical protein